MTVQVLQITIEGRDQASGQMARISGSVQQLADKAKVAQNSTSGLALKIAGVGAAFELAKKGAEIFARALADTIARSLEFRRASDPALQQFEAFEKSATRLQARVGDLLIPALQGIVGAMGPVMASLERWIAANEKMLQAKVVEFLRDMATTLVSSVATGVNLVVKAWLGWSLIIDTVRLGANVFFSLLLSGVERGLQGLASLNAALGRDEAAQTYADQAKAIRGLGSEFDRAADEAGSSLLKTSAQLAAVTKTIDDVEAALKNGVVDAAARAADAIDKGAKRSNTSQKGVAEAAKKAAEAQAKEDERIRLKRTADLLGLEEGLIDAQAKLRERASKDEAAENEARFQILLDQFKKRQDDQKRLQEEAINAQVEKSEERLQRLEAGAERFSTVIHSAILTGFNAIAGGTETLGAAFGDFFTNLGLQILEALTKFALLAGMRALLGGVSGGALGVLGTIFGFAHGGFVTGGMAGRDSVPAMLMPGEYVLPVQVVQSIRRGAPPPITHFANGGSVQAPSASPGPPAMVVHNYHVQTLAVPNRAQSDRWLRDSFLPAQKRLNRNGVK